MPASELHVTHELGVVLLVDDHQVFADLLTFALAPLPDVAEVLHAVDVATAAELIATREPTTAVVDMQLSEGHGLDVVTQIRAHHPRCRVVVLTGHPRRREAQRALELGAAGYLAKDGSLDLLLQVLRGAPAAGPVVEASFPEESLFAGLLTPREREILVMLVDGRDAARIAADLRLSVLTVRSHIKSVLAKLGVQSQLEAVAKASRSGVWGASAR